MQNVMQALYLTRNARGLPASARRYTGEQIYQSKAIPVGSKIERAALDVELPTGSYECTAMFHNLDPETGDIIGTAGAIITITIKN